MAREHLERIGELAHALDIDTDAPQDPHQRLQWLTRHHAWLHAIQELTLEELESNWHMQQVARAELHGDI